MTNRDRKILGLTVEGIKESLERKGSADLFFEVQKAIDEVEFQEASERATAEFEKSSKEMEDEFQRDCEEMHKEFEEAKRASEERWEARKEKMLSGESVDDDPWVKLDKMLESF